jgi:hypothetical protein
VFFRRPKELCVTCQTSTSDIQGQKSDGSVVEAIFRSYLYGPPVKLILKIRERFLPEEQKTLGEISGTISEMSRDEIRLELCLFAAKVFCVDPGSFLPGIKHVGNGWISSMAYQAKGYPLIPAY